MERSPSNSNGLNWSPSSGASVLSSSASCSSLSSRSSGSSVCYSDPIDLTVPRPNEHLAVLLSKALWKPDSAASNCDSFHCRVPFTIFERRHHCRKCGGLFCQPCSSRSTPLLDASNLAFLHPPRNTPLTVFESPESPIVVARVCDDCYDQIHGLRSPASPPAPARPALRVRTFVGRVEPPRTHHPPPLPDTYASLSHTTILPAGGLTRSRTRPSSPRSLRSATFPSPAERSYGELDAYPLRRASLLCKASAAAAGSPSPRPPTPPSASPSSAAKPRTSSRWSAKRPRRSGRSNPVIRDGDFQYRFPAMCDPEPIILERPPLQLSTF
ncbi:FYVE zinc finger-domain-containing protein [Mycena galopus ATCC 62051]|nr:FYVE zinc finger-domain-containing protein [Mycena galopus ATCC 62051]